MASACSHGAPRMGINTLTKRKTRHRTQIEPLDDNLVCKSVCGHQLDSPHSRLHSRQSLPDSPTGQRDPDNSSLSLPSQMFLRDKKYDLLAPKSERLCIPAWDPDNLSRSDFCPLNLFSMTALCPPQPPFI